MTHDNPRHLDSRLLDERLNAFSTRHDSAVNEFPFRPRLAAACCDINAEHIGVSKATFINRVCNGVLPR